MDGNIQGRQSDEETSEREGLIAPEDFKLTAADLILHESHQLQRHLLNLTHRLMAIDDAEHHRIGGHLQDEILQTLVGIHIRLLALDRKVSLSGHDLNKHIASARRSLRESWDALRSATRAVVATHEA